ncbi:MAG: hypothetical protein ACO1SV_24820 [Fimbriimonas sp.]
MNAPPPPYTPPPVRSTTAKTWTIVIGLLLFFVLLCGGLGVYGFGKVKEMTKQDPKPMSGFGKPRVAKKLKGGWMTYAFADLGMEADFPNPPAPGKIEWTAEQRLVTKAWSLYELNTMTSLVEIEATEYVLDIVYTSEELAEMLLESYKSVHPSVREELSDVKVGNLPAKKQRLEFEVEGQGNVAEAYHFVQGKRAMGIRFSYPSLLATEARSEIDRILKSVRFEN